MIKERAQEFAVGVGDGQRSYPVRPVRLHVPLAHPQLPIARPPRLAFTGKFLSTIPITCVIRSSS